MLPSPGAGKVSEAFRLAEGQVPRVPGDEFAAGVRLVGLDAADAEQDVDTFAAQTLDAAAEWGAGGECGVDEREDDDRDAEDGGLREEA